MERSHKKKKILFVITKSNWGGAQKYVYDLATMLPQEKFDVAVALGDTARPAGSANSGDLAKELRAAKIRTIHLVSLDRDVNPFKDLNSFLELLRLFRSEKPDIVHLNSSKVGGIGALAGRLANVPKIIFTAHAWAFNENRSFVSRGIIKIISWITVILSHKTIAVSEAIKTSALSWPFVKNKIVVIKNWVTLPKFLNREEARAEMGILVNMAIPADAFLVGTIAELHKNKGLSYAIEAFAKIASKNPTFYYFIFGEGEERENLSALIKLLNLEKRVFLLGFVKDAKCFLPAIDIFLLPSITEALGIVLLEAGLAEIAVVASRVGGIPEIIENGKTGILVHPADSESIESEIVRLTASPSLRKSLGETLHKKVTNEFSPTKEVDVTFTLYENI